MEPKELQSRLTQLSLGETVLLSEKEFHEVFHVLPETDLRKRVARWFAEASTGQPEGCAPGPTSRSS